MVLPLEDRHRLSLRVEELAEEAMDSVRATVTDGMQDVKAESQDDVTDVRDRASDAMDTWRTA